MPSWNSVPTSPGKHSSRQSPAPLHQFLHRSLLATAVTLATLLSGAAVHSADRSAPAAVAAKNESAKAAPTPAVHVTISGNGAVYLLRDGATLQFWLVDETTGTVQRKAGAAFDPSVDDIVAVELGDAVTGLFYADNLREAGDQFRLSLRSDSAQGRIALPLPKASFDALAAVSVPDEIVAVAPDQADLLALIDRQHAIYARVDSVVQTHADQVELFRIEAEHELVDFYEFQVQQVANGQALLDAAQAATQDLHDRFIARVTADLAVLQNTAAEIVDKGTKEVARYEGPVIQCVNAEAAKLNDQLKRLQASLAAAPEDESYSAAYESLIATAEQDIERSEARLMACADPGALENYSPGVAVDAEGGDYQSIMGAAQALIDALEPRIDAWEAELEQIGLAKAARIENSTVAASALALQHDFDEWISPVYADENDPPVTPELPASRSKIADAATTAGGAKAVEAEVLCDGETWNLEFALGSFTVVLGTPWDDKVVSGNETNIVATFRGNDCIESHAGHDVVIAGPGNDVIYAGEGHDFLFGGRGKDEIHGGAGASYTVTAGPVVLEFDLGNLLVGQADDDRLFGGEVAADRGDDELVDEHGYTDIILGDALLFGHPAGNDFIDGEMGIDFLFGMQGDDQIVNIQPGVFRIEGIDVPFGSFFFGGIGNDTIVGSNTTIAGVFPLLGDFIFGNEGNDIVSANAGVDFVFGGDGGDRIDAGRDMDFAFGQNDNDSVVGNDGADLVTGRHGDDVVRGSDGLIDLVFGGGGNDTLYGDNGMDLIFGRDGVDTIYGGNGIDLIFGAGEGDVIEGNDGVDLVLGGPGEDRINGGDGIDLLFGMTESDVIRGGNATDVILGNGNSEKKQEYLYGEAGIDLVFGLSGNDVIEGGDDLDLLFGNDGTDVISGNGGTDLIFGGLHNDTIAGNDGIDVLFGGEHKDTIDGGASTDLIFGGADCDTIAGGDGADLIFGGDSKDKITGGNGVDIVFGGGQQDHVQGGPDTDILFGGADHDYLSGDDAMDLLFGGDGNDYLLGGAAMDIAFGGSGDDFARGDAGLDLLFGGANNDTLDGGDDTDLLFGGGDDDRLNGGNGNDLSFGGGGSDRLRSVEGSDWAFAGAGNDWLDGYSPGTPDPRDWLWGGGGDDHLSGNSSNQKDLRFGGGGSDTKVTNTTYVAASEFSVSWAGNLVCDVP